MSRGTIIYIGGFELPDKNAAAHRVLSNGKIMRTLGYTVVFISVDKNLAYATPVSETRQVMEGFVTWRVPYPHTSRQWIHYLSSIEAFLTVAGSYPDLQAVICYNYQAAALMKAKEYCRRHEIKIMADCTEWYTTQGTSLVYKVLKGLDTWLRMRIIHKQLDGLIVISKYLEQYYRSCPNLLRLPPLVDLSEEKWRQPVCQYDKKVRLLYAGIPALRQKDKLDQIIGALYRLGDDCDYCFTIVGINRELYLQEHPNHAQMLEVLGKRVVFKGRLPHQETLQQVMRADFTIFVRDNTRVNNAGFPTKFAESISCGVPVITNPTSNIDDYLIDGENGFWLNGTMHSTLQKLLSMDPEQLRTMKKNVNRSTFDYNTYLNEVAHWIEAGISSSNRGGAANAGFGG